jgi:hypothetical protein
MSEHRNTSPYSQRRAQTYDTHAAGGSSDPYDGVEVSQGDAKRTMADRAQSLRHSSKCRRHHLRGRQEVLEECCGCVFMSLMIIVLMLRSNKSRYHGRT